MSTTLSYGYKKPETGDKGSSFFPDLDFDIQQLNDHSHNGTDSALLTSSSVASVTATAAAASWGSDLGGGFYRQNITMPASMSYDNYQVIAKNTAGHVVFPRVEKISITNFYIYTNDNSQAFTIYYVS